MKNIFDFSVGFDNEIEEVVPWTGEFSEETGEGFINELLGRGKLIVGERCEGSVSISEDTIRIEYRWCSNVGEDWNTDEWIEEVLEMNRNGFGR